MTGTPAGSPEPTLADVLAAVSEQKTALEALTALVQQGFAQLATAVAGVKADVADVRREVADSEDRLRGEIRASEANLVSRVNAVQEVVRSVKADVAAHVNDPNAHHRHAA